MAFLEGTWLQVHQFNHLPTDRNSLAELITLARQFRAGGLLVKAFDGDAWMGSEISHPDTAPDGLRAFEQIADQRARCSSAGLGYGVWTNPLHPDDFPHLGSEFIDRQADLYAKAGNAAGLLVFDSEDGAGFWGGNRPVGDARRLMERFRAQAPNCVTVWQPDGRRQFGHLQRLRPEEWGPNMNVYSPQVYWTDFQRPCKTVVQEHFATFRDLKASGQLWEGAEWRPTFPGDAEPRDLLDSMALAATQGATSCIIFQLATLRPENFPAIREAAG